MSGASGGRPCRKQMDASGAVCAEPGHEALHRIAKSDRTDLSQDADAGAAQSGERQVGLPQGLSGSPADGGIFTHTFGPKSRQALGWALRLVGGSLFADK